MIFRKVGGFVYIMSVLVSMEGALADPPVTQWHAGQCLGFIMFHIKLQCQLLVKHTHTDRQCGTDLCD